MIEHRCIPGGQEEQRPGVLPAWHTRLPRWQRIAKWAAAGLLAILPCAYVMADTTGGQRNTQPVIESKSARHSPFAFGLPDKVSALGLHKDTSAGGRYAAMQAADAARTDYRDYFGSKKLAPGQFIWRSEPRDPSALHIVVSIPDQRAYLYEGPIMLAATTVSTGRQGHATPAGIFPIIEKYELKLSNLYDDAPMHYMQRLTYDGIALHAGHIPGVPASHGCIRLPMAFAQKLYSVTKSGTPVLVST